MQFLTENSHSKGLLEEKAGDELREAEYCGLEFATLPRWYTAALLWGYHPKETCNSDSDRHLKL